MHLIIMDFRGHNQTTALTRTLATITSIGSRTDDDRKGIEVLEQMEEGKLSVGECKSEKVRRKCKETKFCFDCLTEIVGEHGDTVTKIYHQKVSNLKEQKNLTMLSLKFWSLIFVIIFTPFFSIKNKY